MKKKILVTLMAALLVLTSAGLSGCGSGGDDGKLDVLMIENFTRMGEDQNTPVTRALQEKFDVEFTYITGATIDDVSSLLGQLVYGNETPDLVISQTVDINRYPSSFLDLTDYADRMPNAFKYLNEEEVRPYVERDDGSILYTPTILEIQAQVAYIIRTDWLENVGLDIPDTIEEFEEVMYAFAQEDPNQNGLDDTYGFVQMSSEWEPSFVMNYGGSNSNILRGDELVFGPTEDVYRETLEKMKQWYRDGVLYDELATFNIEDFQELVANGQVGFTRAYFNRLEDCMDWSSGDPDAKWAIILPPVAEDGKRYEQMSTSRVGNYGIAIAKNSPYKDVLIDLVDYLYSDEGRLLTSFGVEGETYEMVDGEPTFLPAVTDHERWTDSRSVKTYYGIEPQTHFAMVQDTDSFIFRQEVMDGIELLQENAAMYSNMPAVPPVTLNISYTDEGRRVALTDWYQIYDTSQAESFKFIIGERPLNDSEWSKFQNELNSLNLSSVMQTLNTEYKRVMNSK